MLNDLTAKVPSVVGVISEARWMIMSANVQSYGGLCYSDNLFCFLGIVLGTYSSKQKRRFFPLHKRGTMVNLRLPKPTQNCVPETRTRLYLHPTNFATTTTTKSS